MKYLLASVFKKNLRISISGKKKRKKEKEGALRITLIIPRGIGAYLTIE